MPEYSQKYTIVQFFGETSVGESFHMRDWPLHITLADVFAITLTDELMSELARYIERCESARSHITSEGLLGETAVWLLDPTPSLIAMHRDIVAILEKHGAVFNSPHFVNNGYIPHITKQLSGEMKLGDAIQVNVISLVDMFPGNDWQTRKILATLPGTNS